MASKTVIRPIAVLQVQFAIISYLTERNIIKVNYHLGMKDMLRDMMQDHAISVIIVIWRTLQNRSSVHEHGSFFIPLRLDIYCIGLVAIWSFF